VDSKWVWTAATAACYGWFLTNQGLAAMVVVPEIGTADRILWSHAAGYLMLGILLLGTTARWWSASKPVLWRPLMIVAGAALAAVEVAARHTVAEPSRIELWLAAALGLSLAALLVRVLPGVITRRWLRIDPRD